MVFSIALAKSISFCPKTIRWLFNKILTTYSLEHTSLKQLLFFSLLFLLHGNPDRAGDQAAFISTIASISFDWHAAAAADGRSTQNQL
jgi:hypothetical protein